MSAFGKEDSNQIKMNLYSPTMRQNATEMFIFIDLYSWKNFDIYLLFIALNGMEKVWQLMVQIN